jgi:2-C-methyl-D-erythritol 2,4-cyclodiphosphate synthase
MEFRSGIGYDAHRWAEGRPLILGGVSVPHARGLQGHSDADALCHAVCDAVLGAAGLGDMGKYFPDTEARWKGADSRTLLAECVRLAAADGWRLGNLDAVVVCQKPKLAPYLESMRESLGQLLGAAPEKVNVKAKTTEGMGFEGREEGLSVQAVVLLVKD